MPAPFFMTSQYSAVACQAAAFLFRLGLWMIAQGEQIVPGIPGKDLRPFLIEVPAVIQMSGGIQPDLFKAVRPVDEPRRASLPHIPLQAPVHLRGILAVGGGNGHDQVDPFLLAQRTQPAKSSRFSDRSLRSAASPRDTGPPPATPSYTPSMAVCPFKWSRWRMGIAC